MKWKKLGNCFSVEDLHPLLYSHATNPLPLHLHDDVFRIFFSSRDKEKRSSVSYVDLDILNNKIIKINADPLISYGEANSFYSHGISIGNSYSNEGKQYILFMGWEIPENKHWRGHIGRVLLSDNLEKLTLDPAAIFLKDDEEDNISLSYPFVIFHDNIYKMWYGSTISWDSVNGEMIHVMKYATSSDGKTWKKHGIAIPYEVGVAQAFSHPTVIIDKTGYHMWYSFRSGNGTPYRIGYSFSSDGISWQRYDDEAGIDVSAEGWDSEMICYPFVFDHKGKRFMLYNGNEYGKTGFGIAVLES